jgi:hypothetical protein
MGEFLAVMQIQVAAFGTKQPSLLLSFVKPGVDSSTG